MRFGMAIPIGIDPNSLGCDRHPNVARSPTKDDCKVTPLADSLTGRV
jgi:hypothetical protein